LLPFQRRINCGRLSERLAGAVNVTSLYISGGAERQLELPAEQSQMQILHAQVFSQSDIPNGAF
jgi:hypothetical protein